MVTHAVEPLALFSVIVAEGPDAETFLQGQLTNSLQSLTPQTHQRTGYCSAKGRLLAIAQAWSIDPQAFGLLLPTELAGPITRRLGMYILRAKARLSVATADVSAVWNSPEPLAEGQLRNLGGGVFQLGFANCPVRGARSLEVRLRPATNSARPSEPSPNGLEANPLSGQPSGVGANTNAWALADVRSGTPWIWTQTQDLFVPQMINLELVGGVDFKKGCYPGQEVVARSQYLGRLNRRMFGLEWPATEDPVLPGSPVWSPADAEQPCGAVVAVAEGPEPGLQSGLVSVSLDAWPSAESQGLRISQPDGPQARPFALPYAIPTSPQTPSRPRL